MRKKEEYYNRDENKLTQSMKLELFEGETSFEVYLKSDDMPWIKMESGGKIVDSPFSSSNIESLIEFLQDALKTIDFNKGE